MLSYIITFLHKMLSKKCKSTSVTLQSQIREVIKKADGLSLDLTVDQIRDDVTSGVDDEHIRIRCYLCQKVTRYIFAFVYMFVCLFVSRITNKF